jgi:hypothetical protein
MRWVFRRLDRERRRALIATLLTLVAGAFAHGHVARSPFALPGWLVGGLAFMLVLMALAVVFSTHSA